MLVRHGFPGEILMLKFVMAGGHQDMVAVGYFRKTSVVMAQRTLCALLLYVETCLPVVSYRGLECSFVSSVKKNGL